ncbi:peptide chain release factor 1 [Rhizophagus clarus]|uniref:Peptide chain release factor 1 n=1 Tax=Rhizophagus clarus TaxID=94130 RepID=A0A8H3MGK2_9GLOM|nr:peptide chain release factor 1 [Rhizophagus clarus]
MNRISFRKFNLYKFPKYYLSPSINSNFSFKLFRLNVSYSTVSTSQDKIVKETLFNPKIHEKLENLVIRHSKLSEKLSKQISSDNPEEIAKLSKELSSLIEITNSYNELKKAQGELEEVKSILHDSTTTTEEEFKILIQEEYQEYLEKVKLLEQQVIQGLLPKDRADEGNAIIELRAGTGGDEAALFVNDILRMYERYAELRRWKFEILSKSEDTIGAVKEVIATISGKGVFGNMKFESGVHRVQRVPITEKAGRIHTSTITVAILPVPSETEVKFKESDLRIDYYRSSGKGGQHVNTTSSAVRITHIPSGIVVSIQDERSQPKNKAKALQILQARLYDTERSKLHRERSENRKQQVGTGERSEKIRTYNFAQNRVTDHRINLTLYELDNVLNGESLQVIVDGLKVHNQIDMLQSSI